MKKSEFNEKFRAYARTLSPQQNESDLVSKIYKSLTDLLGENNCIQIGSYPRFTSITLIHDLDVLYILGIWDDMFHDPSRALSELKFKLDEEYQNPTEYDIKISFQTHSVTISFTEEGKEKLSLDIVPAYIYGKNEFQQDTYKVPEIIKEKSHEKRKKLYEGIRSEERNIDWIKSDPRGYIKVASELDGATNGEFRKTIKFVKKWKNNLKDEDEKLKLKSFHVEQIITRYFKEDTGIEISGAVFKFFVELAEIINNPNKISDRANSDKFIDDYLEDFSDEQKQKIKFARDGFLKKLEEFDDEDSVEELLETYFYERPPTEEFLFDSGIPVLKEEVLTIAGWIQDSNGQNSRRLSLQGVIDIGHRIKFRVDLGGVNCDLYKWKVRNDDSSPQPRGDITDNHTQQDPESTAYKGSHYVECYAIRGGVCIASARQYVIILNEK